MTLDDLIWSHAKIPTRFGGLGIQAISDFALPANVSSRCFSFTLCRNIVGKTCEGSIRAANSLIDEVWSYPRPDGVNLQSSLDNVLCHVKDGKLKRM